MVIWRPWQHCLSAVSCKCNMQHIICQHMHCQGQYPFGRNSVEILELSLMWLIFKHVYVRRLLWKSCWDWKWQYLVTWCVLTSQVSSLWTIEHDSTGCTSGVHLSASHPASWLRRLYWSQPWSIILDLVSVCLYHNGLFQTQWTAVVNSHLHRMCRNYLLFQSGWPAHFYNVIPR